MRNTFQHRMGQIKRQAKLLSQRHKGARLQ